MIGERHACVTRPRGHRSVLRTGRRILLASVLSRRHLADLACCRADRAHRPRSVADGMVDRGSPSVARKRSPERHRRARDRRRNNPRGAFSFGGGPRLASSRPSSPSPPILVSKIRAPAGDQDLHEGKSASSRSVTFGLPRGDCRRVLSPSESQSWTPPVRGPDSGVQRARDAAYAEARERDGPEAESRLHSLRFSTTCAAAN